MGSPILRFFPVVQHYDGQASVLRTPDPMVYGTPTLENKTTMPALSPWQHRIVAKEAGKLPFEVADARQDTETYHGTHRQGRMLREHPRNSIPGRHGVQNRTVREYLTAQWVLPAVPKLHIWAVLVPQKTVPLTMVLCSCHNKPCHWQWCQLVGPAPRD